MRWGCHFIIYGRLIFVLVKIFGCVQYYIINNKVFELLKYLFTTAITYCWTLFNFTQYADEGSLLDCPSWSPSGGEVTHMHHTGRNGLRLVDRPGPMVDCRSIRKHCGWCRSQRVNDELE